MRTGRIKLLALIQLLSHSVNFLLQLIAVPVFLSAWGPDLYGEWLTLMAIPLLASQMDIGFGSASAPLIAKSLHEGDQRNASSLFWAGLVATTLSAALICVIYLLAMKFLWLGAEQRALSAARAGLVLWIGLGLAVMSMFMRSGWSLLFASDKQVTGDVAFNLAFFAEAALPVGLLLTGAIGPVTLAAVLLASRGLFLAIILGLAFAKAGWLFAHNVLDSATMRRAVGQLWRPAMGYFADPLSNILQTQGVLFAAGWGLNPGAATIIYAHRLLTRAAWQLSNAVRAITIGEMVRLYAQSDAQRLLEARLLIVSAYVWLANVCFAGLVTLGPLIITHWVGRSVSLDLMLLTLFSASLPFFAVIYGAKSVLAASNHHYRLSWIELVLSFVCVGVLMVAFKGGATLGYAAVGVVVLGFVLAAIAIREMSAQFNMSDARVTAAICTALPATLIARLAKLNALNNRR